LSDHLDKIRPLSHAARQRNLSPARRQEIARKGGLAGGKARAAKLSAKKRSEIARKGAAARWAKKKKGS
jgi:general stress protein YciG